MWVLLGTACLLSCGYGYPEMLTPQGLSVQADVVFYHPLKLEPIPLLPSLILSKVVKLSLLFVTLLSPALLSSRVDISFPYCHSKGKGEKTR